MCSVLLLHRQLEDASLAALFVRDEDLGRPGGPVEFRAGSPPHAAPVDPLAGGTWFGAGPDLVAGLVNRRGDPQPEGARSRGELVRGALATSNAREALAFVLAERNERVYGGCRFFAGDQKELFLAELPAEGPPLDPIDLSRGAWLVEHRRSPRRMPELFAVAQGETLEAWLARAARDVRGHRPEGAPLCKHGTGHGSVDFSAAALDRDGRIARLLHQQGAPCQGNWTDHEEIVRALRR